MADERARALRKTLTRDEARLWLRLRVLRPLGIHVRRQVPVAGYILDFACLRAKLAVEIDGEHHGIGRQREHDTMRSMRTSTVRTSVEKGPPIGVIGTEQGPPPR